MNAFLVSFGGVLAAAGALWGAVATYRNATSTKQKTVADIQGAALERLDKRLEAAEDSILALQRERDKDKKTIRALVAYVDTWWGWWRRGAQPPPPAVPTDLYDVLDPEHYTAS